MNVNKVNDFENSQGQGTEKNNDAICPYRVCVKFVGRDKKFLLVAGKTLPENTHEIETIATQTIQEASLFFEMSRERLSNEIENAYKKVNFFRRIWRYLTGYVKTRRETLSVVDLAIRDVKRLLEMREKGEINDRDFLWSSHLKKYQKTINQKQGALEILFFFNQFIKFVEKNKFKNEEINKKDLEMIIKLTKEKILDFYPNIEFCDTFESFIEISHSLNNGSDLLFKWKSFLKDKLFKINSSLSLNVLENLNSSASDIEF